jgi:CRP-like cAMP-binding protein
MEEPINNKAVIDFFKSGKPVRYSKGELIVRAGVDPDGVYLITKGYIKVYVISEAGEEYIHVLYGPGEIFPILWAFKDMYRDIFCEALEDMVVWRVGKQALLDFARRDVDTAFGLIDTIAEQFAAFSFRVDNLEYKQTTKRLIYRLLSLTFRFGTRNGNSIILEVPLTHKLIADTINLSRESVSREFKKLENDGLVCRQNGKVVLKDIDRLGHMLGDPGVLVEWGLAEDS